MKRLLFTLCLFLLLGLPACWDLREVEERGYILALAVDKTPQGDIRVIGQIPNPRVIGGGLRGMVTPGASIESKPFGNFEGKGATFCEAVRRMSLEVSREPFLAHCRSIIFSENMAREGLTDAVDFLKRCVDMRPGLVNIYVTPEDPARLLSIPNTQAPLPAMRIDEISGWQHLTYRFPQVPLYLFLEMLTSEGQDPFAALVMAEPEKSSPPIEGAEREQGPEVKLKLKGTALFQKFRMVGCLDERETRGLLWVLNKVKGGDSWCSAIPPLPLW